MVDKRPEGGGQLLALHVRHGDLDARGAVKTPGDALSPPIVVGRRSMLFGVELVAAHRPLHIIDRTGHRQLDQRRIRRRFRGSHTSDGPDRRIGQPAISEGLEPLEMFLVGGPSSAQSCSEEENWFFRLSPHRSDEKPSLRTTMGRATAFEKVRIARGVEPDVWLGSP